MAEYLLRRLIYTLITIFAVASILFIIFRLLPGDATLQVISPAMDEAVQKRMKEAFGLDK
ncbi:MAG: ABC transporter permease, partial [Alphaproteobacteria bacterium]